MFGSIRIQQNRINLLAQYFRKKVGYQPGCGRLYNIIIIEVTLSGGFRRFFGHLIQVDRQILISRQDLRPGRFEMMINQLYLVDASLQKLFHQESGKLVSLHIRRFVGHFLIAALRLVSQLLYGFFHLLAYGIQQDVLFAQRFIVFQCALQHLRHVGIESAA